MAAAKVFSYLFILIALFGVVASEPDHLRDLCVANKAAGIKASLARIDYEAGGLNPPHTHPRATEVIFVLDGELDIGFITTANKLISKSIKKGDIFVFAKGLVHFLKNNGAKPASVIAGFNSQLPGTQFIAATLFTSTPPVPDNALTKTFQIGTKEVNKIKNKLAPKKS
ncbi:Cupin 1 - like 10 [Theobroma cacao]|nr:Cupin 1 - like 10 [Theobroma cacao]